MTTGVSTCEYRTVDVEGRVRQAEQRLLIAEIRRRSDLLRDLLHPDFLEIGRSGTAYSREQVVAAVAAQKAGETPTIDEWAFRHLNPGLVLATYRVRQASR